MSPIVTVTLPSDGDTALAENIDNPINAILAVLNGSLDDANIASMNGSKIVAGSLPASALSSSANQGWKPLTSVSATYVQNNGNKEFVVNLNVDVTQILSAGMKFKVARTVTPPTQCSLFVAGSSQYATKASPAGITFTGPFSCESWLYLNSYTGNRAEIVNRLDGAFTSGGWQMELLSTAQVNLQYGTGSSFTNFITYQSIPLNRWVHIAGVVTSVSSKTAVIYINGVAVPTTSSASAATTLTQAAIDLRIGAFANTPANSYLDGYLSETRVWAQAQTSGAIQGNMGINCVGTETGLVALFSQNGNFNDLTSNANNLTATNGAIATQTFAALGVTPFNATEMFVVTKVGAYSGGVTPLTVFGGTLFTLPNQTLSTPQYSTEKTPFGFNSDIHVWKVDTLVYAQQQQSSPSSASWYNLGTQISISTGAWRAGYEAAIAGQRTGTSVDIQVALSTTNNGVSDVNLWGFLQVNGASAGLDVEGMVSKYRGITLSAQTIHYLNVASFNSGAGAIEVQGSNTPLSNSGKSPTIAEAFCAYI